MKARSHIWVDWGMRGTESCGLQRCLVVKNTEEGSVIRHRPKKLFHGETPGGLRFMWKWSESRMAAKQEEKGLLCNVKTGVTNPFTGNKGGSLESDLCSFQVEKRAAAVAAFRFLFSTIGGVLVSWGCPDVMTWEVGCIFIQLGLLVMWGSCGGTNERSLPFLCLPLILILEIRYILRLPAKSH